MLVIDIPKIPNICGYIIPEHGMHGTIEKKLTFQLMSGLTSN